MIRKELSERSIIFRKRYEEYFRYSGSITRELSRIYPREEIKTEWISFKDEIERYSPRLDVAVGPFATNNIYGDRYDTLMKQTEAFISRLIEIHNNNLAEYNDTSYSASFEKLKITNNNARCLYAIEIENRVSRKQLMGSIVNVTALGRIGIIIGWRPEVYRMAFRAKRYVQFLNEVKKNAFSTDNLLIFTRLQLLRALSSV
jgi:hypothetical protein